MTPALITGEHQPVGQWLALAIVGTVGAVASAYLGFSAVEASVPLQAAPATATTTTALQTGSSTTVTGPATSVDPALSGVAAGEGEIEAPAGPVAPLDCPPSFSVHFSINAVEVGTGELDDSAGPLVTWLETHPGAVLLIDGHADASGSEAENLAISFRRAEAVARGLVDAGADEAQLNPRGFGEYQVMAGEPVDSERNRRVVMHVPGYEECQEDETARGGQ